MTGVLMDRHRFAPPVAANFPTFYDAGTGANPSLIDRAGSGLVMKFGAGVISLNTDYVKAAVKAKASASSYDLIARINYNLLFNFSLCGICVADGTKLITFGFGPSSSGVPGLKVSRWTNHTTFSTDLLSNNPVSPQCEWLRIGIVSGDPKDYYVSHNGIDWELMLSATQTGFLTYTQVGIVQVVNRQAGSSWAVSGTNQQSLSVLYFSDPDISPGF